MDALDAPWIAAHATMWLLVIGRVAGLCLTAPLTAIPGMDLRLRLLLSLVLGAVVVPVVEPLLGASAPRSLTMGLLLGEVLTGALLGWSAGLIVVAARQAGELVAAQAGLSAASLLDPESGDELTALGHFYGLIALAVFLAMNGPLVLVSALIESYQAMPAGGLSLSPETASLAFAQVGEALALSLRAAAPPAVAMIVAGIAIGWIGRLAPALPVLALSLPIRAILGISLVFLSLSTLVAILAQAWTRWPWGQ
jgi:flagellar biosynthesis protein FliR